MTFDYNDELLSISIEIDEDAQGAQNPDLVEELTAWIATISLMLQMYGTDKYYNCLDNASSFLNTVLSQSKSIVPVPLSSVSAGTEDTIGVN